MDGSLVVSLLAIALALGSYVRQGALVLTGAYRNMPPEHVKREMHAHFALVAAAVVVVVLAQPFGIYSVLAPAGMFVAHFVFLHTMLAIGFIRHRRAGGDGRDGWPPSAGSRSAP